MSLLRPLDQKQLPPPEPMEICESCGKSLPRSHALMSFIIVGGAKPFQCPGGGHVACSIECWAKVSHACIDEHMVEILSRPIPV